MQGMQAAGAAAASSGSPEVLVVHEPATEGGDDGTEHNHADNDARDATPTQASVGMGLPQPWKRKNSSVNGLSNALNEQVRKSWMEVLCLCL